MLPGVRAPNPPSTLEGYDQSLFSVVAEVERTSFWYGSRSELIAWALHRHFPRAGTLLEVGCGTGVVLETLHRRFPALQVSGSDLFPQALEHARRLVPTATLAEVDARALTYESQFDVTCAFDVLEHVNEDDVVLAGMMRATASGGGLVVTVPQHRWLWGPMDELAHHVRRYRRGDLLDKIRRAGFRIEFVTSFVSLLLPAMAATRVRLRLRPGPVDLAAQLVPGRGLNTVLRRVMDLERGLIGRGVRFPVGGSLLVVARKL